LGHFYSQVFSLPVGKMLSYFGIVPHGHFLDVPNAMLGCVYYSYILFMIGIVASPSSNRLLVLLTKLISCMAMASSVVLAYQLTFVLNDLCILCWSTHITNTFLLFKIVLQGVGGAESSSSQTKAKMT